MDEISANVRPLAKLKSTLTVGDLSRRSGVSISAIHFYERNGLIAAQRDAANRRRFSRNTLRVLAVINVGRGAGIPLAEIRQTLYPEGTIKALRLQDWEQITLRWRDELDRRIERLSFMRDRLTRCIGCGCLSLESCKAINPGDRLGDAGEGAPGLERADW